MTREEKIEAAAKAAFYGPTQRELNEILDALTPIIEGEMKERCAKACERRAVRAAGSRGSLGGMFAATQDVEANECAAAIRALPPTPTNGETK